MRKWCSIVRDIRPFRTTHSNRTLRRTVTEESGATLFFQWLAHVDYHTGFMVRGDARACNNASTHVSRGNSNLNLNLRHVGVDAVALPAHSPELSPIELVFNVVVQRLASRFNETTLNSNDDVQLLPNSAIESITPDVMFSCYIKCGYRDVD